jgi:hypothetical protein
MSRFVSPKGWLVLLLAAGVAGLLQTVSRAADEDDVRAAFVAFQKALKDKDAGKIWKLLDKTSQTAAERSAKAVQKYYNKADAEKKAKMEKALGLPGDELAKLTGEGFLKTKSFHAKYDEVPGSKIASISVDGDRATVNYVEEDGDKEKMQMKREDGKWKVTAPMPTVAQP